MEPEITKMMDLALNSQKTSPQEGAIMTLLYAILEELIAIREAAEAEAVEDDEPDPFQTLNGPSMQVDPEK